MRTVAIFAILLLTGFGAWAQTRTLYFMEAVPHARLNPGVQATNNAYFMLPGFLNMGFGLSTPSFAVTDFMKRDGDVLRVDLNQLTSQLDDANYINFTGGFSLFHLGFKANDWYFDFGSVVKVETRFAFPGDMMKLLIHGNENYIGKTADFSSLYLNSLVYQEMGLGITKRIDERLSVGIRPKLLFGINANKTRFNEFSLYTDADTYAMRIKTDAEIMVSGVSGYTTDTDGSIEELKVFDDVAPGDFVLKNVGVGIDLGAQYQLNDKISLEAGLLDLGSISWKTNAQKLISKGEFEFSGLDYTGEDDFDAGEQFQDSLKSTFKVTPGESKFRTALTPKLLLAGRYEYSNSVKFGASLLNQFYNGGMHPGLTFSASYYPKSFFSVTGTYSMAEGSATNLGLGMHLSLLGFQAYLVSDRIMGMFSPHKSRSANLQLGFSFVLGNKKGKKEKAPKVDEPKEVRPTGEAAPIG